MSYLWGIFGLLILVAVLGLMCSFRYGGGWWIGYRAIGANRKFRGCKECQGCGVVWLAQQPDGTTAKMAIPKGMRRENRMNEAGDWYSMPNIANIEECEACGGMSGNWVTDADDHVILRMPFPWPWNSSGHGWWKFWEEWRRARAR